MHIQGVTSLLGGKKEVAAKASTDCFRKGFEFGFRAESECAQKESWSERHMAVDLEGVYREQIQGSAGTEGMGRWRKSLNLPRGCDSLVVVTPENFHPSQGVPTSSAHSPSLPPVFPPPGYIHSLTNNKVLYSPVRNTTVQNTSYT